jgi:hypothetical protein
VGEGALQEDSAGFVPIKLLNVLTHVAVQDAIHLDSGTQGLDSGPQGVDSGTRGVDSGT